MNLTQIDDHGRLYAVENLYPEELFQQLLSLDWNNLPYGAENGQETWARRSLKKYEIAVLKQASDYVATLVPELAERFGLNFEWDTNAGNTNWWLDEPGFWVPMHTDGELPMSMQIFIAGPADLGTAFYKHNSERYLLRQFEFVPNTGYLMLNHKNEDGSQPLLWHAMLTKVPADVLRVTSYTVFPKYSHK